MCAFRDSDPEEERRLPKDPLGYGGGANLYGYGGGDPVNTVDPSGTSIHIAIGAGVGGLLGGAVSWYNGDGFGRGFATGPVAGAAGVPLEGLAQSQEGSRA
ncbi:MAG TPA: RHS repeat-associated core domain-containing protein [Armatimonadota bacterium]